MNTTTSTMTTTTAATTTTPIEWFQQFYSSSDATTTTTSTLLPPTNLSFTGPDSCPATVTNPTPSTKLSPVQDGRVTKPARRRTRASRKNPTTLLNTDTSNFRAMVQRYTGGAAPYSPNSFDSPAAGFMAVGGGGGLHLGQAAASFNQAGSGLFGLHGGGVVDLQAHQLHQQLLQQYGAAAFSSTATAGSRGAMGGIGVRAEEEGVSSRAGPGSGLYSGGGGENKRGGFMF